MISIDEGRKIVLKETEDVYEKYNAMFVLRTLQTEEAAKLLEEAYPFLGDSELMRHEIMYVIGQMKTKESINFLLGIMNNENEKSVVRHEAGEALANYAHIKDEIIVEMKKHYESEDSLLRSTVRVGIEKLRNYTDKSRYGEKYNGTIEPAEPFNLTELKEYFKSINVEAKEDINELYNQIEEQLLRAYSDVDEWPKYRMGYFLRDSMTLRCKEILAGLLKKENREFISPLLRHELGFICGQINENDKVIEDALREVSKDETEHNVVRHEAILSFYDISKDDSFIEQFLKHEDQLIRESAIVAHRMATD